MGSIITAVSTCVTRAPDRRSAGIQRPGLHRFLIFMQLEKLHSSALDKCGREEGRESRKREEGGKYKCQGQGLGPLPCVCAQVPGGQGQDPAWPPTTPSLTPPPLVAMEIRSAGAQGTDLSTSVSIFFS